MSPAHTKYREEFSIPTRYEPGSRNRNTSTHLCQLILDNAAVTSTLKLAWRLGSLVLIWTIWAGIWILLSTYIHIGIFSLWYCHIWIKDNPCERNLISSSRFFISLEFINMRYYLFLSDTLYKSQSYKIYKNIQGVPTAVIHCGPIGKRDLIRRKL